MSCDLPQAELIEINARPWQGMKTYETVGIVLLVGTLACFVLACKARGGLTISLLSGAWACHCMQAVILLSDTISSIP